MPVTKVTAPDGTTFNVNHPEGATDEEIIQYAKENYKPHSPADEASYSGMMKDSLRRVTNNTLKHGPYAGITSALKEGLNNAGELIERGGYKAGGAITDALSPYTSPEVAAGAGYVANVGTQLLPSVLGSSATISTLKPLMQKGGKTLMQSALKPNTQELLSGQGGRAVDTLLNNRINVTHGGLSKLSRIEDASSKIVNQSIDNAVGNITKSDPLGEINNLIKDLKFQATPQSDIRKAMKVWDDFHSAHPNSMSIPYANKVKQGTYKALTDKAYTNEVNAADKKAQQAIARGLRVAIEKALPQIGKDNKKWGELINALGILERRVGLTGNLNLTGLAGAAMNPQAAALMMADRSALIKSQLAQELYHGAGPLSLLTGGGIPAAYGLLSERSPGDITR